jgi:hypothetical protein
LQLFDEKLEQNITNVHQGIKIRYKPVLPLAGGDWSLHKAPKKRNA